VNPASARGLVPPRPNLGPEPWTDAQPIWPLLLAAGVLACLLFAWLVLGRRRRGSVRANGLGIPNASPRDATPRGRLVTHSDTIRDMMATQFGIAWRAKTTEELSAETLLEQVLGRDQLQELICFLDQADQLKFAPERSNHHHELLEQELATWEPRLADLKSKIQAKSGARPRA
jgi:hypothetical protein